MQKTTEIKPRYFKLDAEILSKKITLINEFFKIIESKKKYYDYKFFTVREKKNKKSEVLFSHYKHFLKVLAELVELKEVGTNSQFKGII